MVSSRLRAAYPDYAFIGEETYVAGQTALTDTPTFIVDPIDGTTNFVHGFPHACISLGLAVGRRPAVGVVYNPSLDTLYTGIRGRGGFVRRNASLPTSKPLRLPLAGRPPPLSGDLSTALVGIEWGSQREGPNFDVKVETFRRLAAAPPGGAMVHGFRSLGSAAMNLCAVAAGEMDCYWEGGCWAWDVCAGWCILSEAGGRMVGGNPGDWEPALDRRVYLAVRGAPEKDGQEAFVKAFWDVIGEGRLDY